MSYPGYPSQNPPYPPTGGNLPYPINPAGFPTQSNNMMGFNTAPYPPMDPGYPSAPTLPSSGMPSAYPPMQHNTSAMYPPVNASAPPYPSMTPGYPAASAPAYPPASSFPPYPSQQPVYPSQQPAYPSQQPAYPPPQQAPYPSQPSSSPYPTQQHVTTSRAYNSSHSSMSTVPLKKTPTLRPAQPFDPRQDAEVLRKAMKGFGTDEKAIINVLSRRTNQQRIEIINMYKAQFGKDLIKDLKSELGGLFEQVVMAMMTPLPEYLAKELHDAMSGFGTKEGTLIEILCTTNNAWIHAINQSYHRMYNKSLESDIKADTSGHFERLLVSLCQGRRDENPHVDIGAATADAHALYKAGTAKLGTDESTFNMILATRSLPHLRQVFIEYQKLTGKPIENSIKSEFSGDIETGLLAIVYSMKDCPEYFADRLYNSMAGLGTKDRALIRIIVTRAEFDLGDISIAFQRKYKKSLVSFIDGDASGDYKKMLLALVS